MGFELFGYKFIDVHNSVLRFVLIFEILKADTIDQFHIGQKQLTHTFLFTSGLVLFYELLLMIDMC